MTEKPLVNVSRRKQTACALCREWRSSSKPGAPVVATIANYGLCERHYVLVCAIRDDASQVTLPNRVPTSRRYHRAAR